MSFARVIPRVAKHSNAFKHQVRCSAWNFQTILESRIPDYRGRPNRSGADLEKAKGSLPKIVFMTSYEFDVLTKPRVPVKEYTYQSANRRKVAELFVHEAPHKLSEVHVSNPEVKKFAELKALQNFSEYAGDLLELQNQNTQRVNDFVDSNPVYLLDQPWREEARWNRIEEMDNRTRAVVRSELRAWLPQEYQQRFSADIQQTAAFSPSVRKQMLEKIDEQAKAFESEISSLPQEEQGPLVEVLKAEIAKAKGFVDPTADITLEAISSSSDLETLRSYAHRVHGYNGDERMAAIYEKAAQVASDSAGASLAKDIKAAVF